MVSRERFMVGALTLLSILQLPYPAYAQSDETNDSSKTLDMNLHRQSTMVWCWVAAIATVVEYTDGQVVQDCDILNAYDHFLGGPATCCAGDPRCVRGGTADEMETILGRIYGIHGFGLTTFPSFDSIVRQINRNRPYIVLFRTSPASGHAVVVSGYDSSNQTLHVLDPFYGEQDAQYNKLRSLATFAMRIDSAPRTEPSDEPTELKSDPTP